MKLIKRDKSKRTAPEKSPEQTKKESERVGLDDDALVIVAGGLGPDDDPSDQHISTESGGEL